MYCKRGTPARARAEDRATIWCSCGGCARHDGVCWQPVFSCSEGRSHKARVFAGRFTSHTSHTARHSRSETLRTCAITKSEVSLESQACNYPSAQAKPRNPRASQRARTPAVKELCPPAHDNGRCGGIDTNASMPARQRMPHTVRNNSQKQPSLAPGKLPLTAHACQDSPCR